MMSKLGRVVLAVAIVAPMLLAGVGCSKKVTAGSVRGNMTPELESVGMTSQMRKNRTARTVDHTLRQIHDDWDAILLLDRPRKLTKYPIPY